MQIRKKGIKLKKIFSENYRANLNQTVDEMSH